MVKVELSKIVFPFSIKAQGGTVEFSSRKEYLCWKVFGDKSKDYTLDDIIAVSPPRMKIALQSLGGSLSDFLEYSDGVFIPSEGSSLLTEIQCELLRFICPNVVFSYDISCAEYMFNGYRRFGYFTKVAKDAVIAFQNNIPFKYLGAIRMTTNLAKSFSPDIYELSATGGYLHNLTPEKAKHYPEAKPLFQLTYPLTAKIFSRSGETTVNFSTATSLGGYLANLSSDVSYIKFNQGAVECQS